MAFQVKLSIPTQDFDDTFYFKSLPNREQLIKALYKNKAIANEFYSESYNLVIAALRMDTRFPESFSSSTAMVGYPMELGCSISIRQFHFEDLVK